MVMPTIVYKLNQASSRTKDVPFHKGGTGETKGRRRMQDVPFHRGEGGNIYRYAYIIV